MAYKASETFWAPQDFQLAQRIKCKLHEEWVSARWTLKNPGTPAEVYEVECIPSKHACRSHYDDRETITIARAAWDASAPNNVWYCFDPDNPQ